MPDLKEILQRIRQKKQDKKRLTDMVRDARAQSKSYQEVEEQIKALKVKKLQLETAIRSEFSSELEKIEKMNEGIQTDTQLLTDLALTKFMKGETIEIVDENEVKYEPVFKISFKKTV
jgi:septal ring factor EnvC (AmiA/AmiB activator)